MHLTFLLRRLDVKDYNPFVSKGTSPACFGADKYEKEQVSDASVQVCGPSCVSLYELGTLQAHHDTWTCTPAAALMYKLQVKMFLPDIAGTRVA